MKLSRTGRSNPIPAIVSHRPGLLPLLAALILAIAPPSHAQQRSTSANPAAQTSKDPSARGAFQLVASSTPMMIQGQDAFKMTPVTRVRLHQPPAIHRMDPRTGEASNQPFGIGDVIAFQEGGRSWSFRVFRVERTTLTTHVNASDGPAYLTMTLRDGMIKTVIIRDHADHQAHLIKPAVTDHVMTSMPFDLHEDGEACPLTHAPEEPVRKDAAGAVDGMDPETDAPTVAEGSVNVIDIAVALNQEYLQYLKELSLLKHFMNRSQIRVPIILTTPGSQFDPNATNNATNDYVELAQRLPTNHDILQDWMEGLMEPVNETFALSGVTDTRVRYVGIEPIDTTGLQAYVLANNDKCTGDSFDACKDTLANPDPDVTPNPDGKPDTDSRDWAKSFMRQQSTTPSSEREKLGADFIMGILDWGQCRNGNCGIGEFPVTTGRLSTSDPAAYSATIDVSKSSDDSFAMIFPNNHTTYSTDKMKYYRGSGADSDDIKVRIAGADTVFESKGNVFNWDLMDSYCESVFGGRLGTDARGEYCETWRLYADSTGEEIDPVTAMTTASVITSRILVHEVGHNLGVYHSRQQTNITASSDPTRYKLDWYATGMQTCFDSGTVKPDSFAQLGGDCFSTTMGYRESMVWAPVFSSPNLYVDRLGNITRENQSGNSAYIPLGEVDNIDAVRAIEKYSPFLKQYRTQTSHRQDFRIEIPYNGFTEERPDLDCGFGWIRIPCLWAGRQYEVMNPLDIVAQVMSFRNVASTPGNYRFQPSVSRAPAMNKDLPAVPAIERKVEVSGHPLAPAALADALSWTDPIRMQAADQYLWQEDFEAFETGRFGEQAAWIVRSGEEFIISGANPQSGQRHLRIVPSADTTMLFAPEFSGSEEGTFDIRMQLRIPTGDGKTYEDYHGIYFYDAVGQTLTAAVAIQYGQISGFDLEGGYFVTGMPMTPDSYHTLRINFDPVDRVVEYFMDDKKFGSSALIGDSRADQLIFQSIDRGGASVLDVDHITVDRPRYSDLVDFAGMSGYLTPGETGQLAITFAPESVEPGDYRVDLELYLDDAEKPVHTFPMDISVAKDYVRLAVPVPTSPVKGATDVPLNEGLTWKGSERADAYHVMVASDEDFIDIVLEDTVEAELMPFNGRLMQGSTYRWRVRAMDQAGRSTWSEANTFTMAASALGGKSFQVESDYMFLGDQVEVLVLTDPIRKEDGMIAYEFTLSIPSDLELLTVDTAKTMSNNGYIAITLGERMSAAEETYDVTVAYGSTSYIQGDGELVRLTFKGEIPGTYSVTPGEVYFNADRVADARVSEIEVYSTYLGDVDANSKIQAFDAGLALHYSVGSDVLAGLDPLPWEPWRVRAADVDKDGKVLAVDGSNILLRSVGVLGDFSELAGKRGAKGLANDATVQVSASEGRLDLSTSGPGIIGVNIEVPRVDGTTVLQPEVLASGVLSAYNLSGDTLRFAVASTASLEGSFLRIPYESDSDRVLDIRVYANSSVTDEKVTVQMTTLDPGPELPTVFALEQNYPNPFNPSTVIRYALPTATRVRMEVFTITGQRVAVLVDGDVSAGFHQVAFDAESFSSGLYVYRITTPEFTASRRMLLIK